MNTFLNYTPHPVLIRKWAPNRIFLLCLLLGLCLAHAHAQVKIGDNASNINGNSLLELESPDKGLLLPRVALTGTDSAAPLDAFVQGMTVYNTATAGTGGTAVRPGHYLSDGTRWVRVAFATEADTTDDSWRNNADDQNIALAYLSDGSTPRSTQASLIVRDNGDVGIGTSVPITKLDIGGDLRIGEVNNIPKTVMYKPLVWNTNTLKVQTTEDNTSVKGAAEGLASGSTINLGPPLTAIFAGAYELKILVSSSCGQAAYNKFLIVGATGPNTGINVFWRINYLGGVAEGGPATTTFSGGGNSIVVTNPVNGGTCADGGNSTSLNYTVSLSSSGQLSITNNGNVPRDYILIAEKVME